MTAITEDYVSFEVAKLLKDKGFDEATNRYYNAQNDQFRTVSDTFLWHWNDEEFMKRVLMDGAIAIPTLQMAMKWLREEKGIAAVPILSSVLDNEKFLWDIEITVAKTNENYHQGWIYESYEQAVEAAIKYSLENLI